jgi:Deoxynucleoside kinases
MPKKNFIIVVSSGPATGKSTLVKLLAEHYSATAFLEGEEDDVPERIWQDIKSGENLLEMSIYFRNKRVDEYRRAMEIKKDGGRAIMDSFHMTNNIYAENWMQDEFAKELVKNITDCDSKLLPEPDLLICMSCGRQKSLDFISWRGRKNEDSERLLDKYWQINEAHDKYYKKHKIKNTYFLDRTDLDFKTKKDFDFLIKEIDKRLK